MGFRPRANSALQPVSLSQCGEWLERSREGGPAIANVALLTLAGAAFVLLRWLQ